MRHSGAIFVIGLAAVLLAGAAGVAVAAEEGAASALATWAGQGRLFQTGEKQALFVGAFQGVMFVENGQGILHAARILCPGSMDVDLGTGDQKGEGRCIVTGRSGDRVFARWTCAGTLVIDQETGKLTATLANREAAFVLFGACTVP